MPEFITNAHPIVYFLVGLGSCLWIYNQLRTALGKPKLPQPLEIQLTRRFVERDDHEKALRVMDERMAAAAASRKKTHERLDAVESRTARLEEQNKAQTDSINLLRADLREYCKENRQFYREIMAELRNKGEK